MVRGNFLGATIVAIINLILVDVNALGKLPKTSLVALNVILNFLIIFFMWMAFLKIK